MTNNNEISMDPAVLSDAGIQDAVQALRNLELVRKRLGPDHRETRGYTLFLPCFRNRLSV